MKLLYTVATLLATALAAPATNNYAEGALRNAAYEQAAGAAAGRKDSKLSFLESKEPSSKRGAILSSIQRGLEKAGTDRATDVQGTTKGVKPKSNLCYSTSERHRTCCDGCGGCPSRGTCRCNCDVCGQVECNCPRTWCNRCGRSDCGCLVSEHEVCHKCGQPECGCPLDTCTRCGKAACGCVPKPCLTCGDFDCLHHR